MRQRKLIDASLTQHATQSTPLPLSLSPLKDCAQNHEKNGNKSSCTQKITTNFPPKKKIKHTNTNPAQSFLLAKFFILRLLGFIYLISFLGAYYQNRGLLGSNGLNPVNPYMEELRSTSTSKYNGFLSNPTLFWLIDGPILDKHLDMISISGIFFSTFVMIGLNSWLVMFLLWLLDFSIVTVAGGSSFYSYGWESQLLETGFLAIFLCDVPHFVVSSIKRDKRAWKFQGLWRDSTVTSTLSPPSLATLWLFRWLCFRISLGAGLIKLRGSSCWQDRTCLYYHFETQPIPSPFSFGFHFLPKSFLKMAVNLDYFVQLYSIWLVLIPGFSWMVWLRRLGGFIQVSF